jgi:hypothetical protein
VCVCGFFVLCDISCAWSPLGVAPWLWLVLLLSVNIFFNKNIHIAHSIRSLHHDSDVLCSSPFLLFFVAYSVYLPFRIHRFLDMNTTNSQMKMR